MMLQMWRLGGLISVMVIIGCESMEGMEQQAKGVLSGLAKSAEETVAAIDGKLRGTQSRSRSEEPLGKVRGHGTASEVSGPSKSQSSTLSGNNFHIPESSNVPSDLQTAADYLAGYWVHEPASRNCAVDGIWHQEDDPGNKTQLVINGQRLKQYVYSENPWNSGVYLYEFDIIGFGPVTNKIKDLKPIGVLTVRYVSGRTVSGDVDISGARIGFTGGQGEITMTSGFWDNGHATYYGRMMGVQPAWYPTIYSCGGTFSNKGGTVADPTQGVR